jgi:hypothetical protein
LILNRYPIIQFFLLVTITLGITFIAHVFLLGKNGYPPYADLLPLSYLVNGVLAFVIYALLYFFRHRLKSQIGFLFMGGSFLKFLFFFLLFYPVYHADGTMNRLEFAAFFVPYGICLLLETLFTAKMLQKLE